MGKSTLYHPVSLHVIRGAAEYCGFKLGRVNQRYSEPERKTARYIVDITDFPFDPAQHSLADIRKAFQQCFMKDIRVEYLLQARSGRYVAALFVKLRTGFASRQDLEETLEAASE